MNLEYWISTTFSLLNWLFFHTIYGMLGVAILVYLLFRDLRKTFPRFPEPALVAGLVFLVGAGTLPSIPRFQFHNEMLKLMPQIEGSGRVASTSSWRSMTEPLTWVNPPIGEVTLIWPQFHVVRDGQRISSAHLENHFIEWTLRYGEERAESLVEIDCVQSTIRYTRPDKSGIGILRPVMPSPVKMVAREKDWYCAHERSREKGSPSAELSSAFSCSSTGRIARIAERWAHVHLREGVSGACDPLRDGSGPRRRDGF